MTSGLETPTPGLDIPEFLDALQQHGSQRHVVWRTGIRSAYLAGPMRGIEKFNYPLFNAVTAWLESMGYMIENPAQTDAEVAERAQAAENPLSVYMERDLADVAKTQAVFVLPGWESSEGATIETTVAWMLKHPVYELPEFKLVEPVEPFFTKKKLLDTTLPTGSEARKGIPITTGLLDYFPAALAAVAAVSKAGNDKHNPGEPLHWDRQRSMDQADCIGRHLIERGGFDPETGQRHSAQLAWRALAMLQIELEDAGEAPLSRGSS